jgi:polysaccharide biosynthesis transport protein
MNLSQFLLILKARHRIALATFFSIVGLTLVISLLVPASYTAVTTVLIDVGSADPIGGVVVPPNAHGGYMATQLDIIRSERVAQRAVKILRLNENPEVKDQWLEATGGHGHIDVWLGGVLLKKLVAWPGRESNVVNIAYTSPDPGFASQVANAFAEAYVDTNVSLKTEPAKQYADWFRNQISALRDGLEKAQGRLSEYQQRKGIVVTDERLDSENARLNELSTALTMVQTQTGDAQSKGNAKNAATLPEIAGNPVVMTLKSDMHRLQAKLEESNIGPNHPQYQRIQTEIERIRQQLASEATHLSTGFDTSASVGKVKEDTLKALIAGQKEKLLQLRHERDEAAVLLRDVEAAQKAYDAVSARLTQTRLESLATQTNIAVLTPATPPLEPASPQPMLYTLIAAIAGLLLGICAAFAKEILDRRVRTTDDLELALDIPVLANVERVKVFTPRRHLALGFNRSLKGPSLASPT